MGSCGRRGELAGPVGSTPSAVYRREEGDCEGHSLSMLRRLAGVVDKRVEIRFVLHCTGRPGARDSFRL
jgi:hypothetical protein